MMQTQMFTLSLCLDSGNSYLLSMILLIPDFLGSLIPVSSTSALNGPTTILNSILDIGSRSTTEAGDYSDIGTPSDQSSETLWNCL